MFLQYLQSTNDTADVWCILTQACLNLKQNMTKIWRSGVNCNSLVYTIFHVQLATASKKESKNISLFQNTACGCIISRQRKSN